jgi:hypothetical protein
MLDYTIQRMHTANPALSQRGLDDNVIVANDDLRRVRGVHVLAVNDEAAYAMPARLDANDKPSPPVIL